MERLFGRTSVVLFLIILYCWSPVRPQAQTVSPKHVQTQPPIYISFLWHMHQPIYWPYESVVQTDALARYPYSVVDIFNQRTGPYTTWPGNAVQKGISAGFSHFGAQVSFSGSLIENLNNLEAAGNGNFAGWKSTWNYVKNESTALGNPRLDMVGFGYHHPLMGLLDYDDTRRQTEAHKQIMASNFAGSYSKGIFPPENAFSPREIPALVDEGFQWVLVDNIHFDRACNGYPFSTAGNLYEPNGSDARNPNPGDWVQLSGLWAPTQTSARWGRQPHFVQYVDPATGQSKKIIAVPADRYMGNEDGRGGFGALNYDGVMSQLESYNTDPNHPILIVLHHDGDNYGGGSDSYYNSNFQSFVDWLLANPTRFVCTTVQDYLEMFPPDSSDVIHIEDGSWSGADNGDPEFLKWNGDPTNGYSPDRNSWGVVTAAKNIVETAQQINPSSPNMPNAWKFMLNGEASDYWYWDGSQNGIWDAHPTRACNQAVQYALPVISGGSDETPPTIYLPQREPYNPGGTEWGINQPSDFTVWSYVYDVSGLQSVTLKVRTSTGTAMIPANETYAGGTGVGPWTDLPMTSMWIAPQTNPLPLYKANQYSAVVSGLTNVLTDYYIEAVDSAGNIGRSPIRHVWVGTHSGSGTTGVSWTPVAPTVDDSITINVAGATQGGLLHWGVNNSGSTWQQPNSVFWPAGSSLFGGTGPAVQTPMSGPDTAGSLKITLPPFNNAIQGVQRVAFVIHYNNNTWDNNSGLDYHITIGGSQPTQTFVMDGLPDSSALLLDSAQGMRLYVGWNGSDLYVATQSAPSQGGDVFILLADSLRSLTASPWAKSGSSAGWNAFLGNESTNNWTGWFNSAGGTLAATTSQASGAYLEGTVNVLSLFNRIPPVIYIAAARYQTQDGGALLAQVPAGNGNGNIDTSEFAHYSYALPAVPPPVPLPLYPGNGSVDRPLSLTLRWSHILAAESYEAALASDSSFNSGIVLSDTGIVDTFRTVGGLSELTKYFWRVRARNVNGYSPWSASRSFTTMPPVPLPPLPLGPADRALDQPLTVYLYWDSVAHASRYELELAPDSLFASLILIDTALTQLHRTVDSLARSTTYFWRVCAVNAAGKSAWSPILRFTTTDASSFTFALARRWNLVSLPVDVPNRSLHSLFPNASPEAFSYDGSGYRLNDSLQPSIGYWVNVPDSGRIAVTGTLRIRDTLQLSPGWNLIGMISDTIPVMAVVTNPPGILGSSFFGYSGSYTVVQSLTAGSGYWIKANEAGVLILQAGPATKPSSFVLSGMENARTMTVADALGKKATLYVSTGDPPLNNAIPPPPPDGAFDVRYGSGHMVESISDTRPGAVSILVSGASYPLSISWEGTGGTRSGFLVVNGRSFPLADQGSVSVPEGARIGLATAAPRTLPAAFSLGQNFPNPFNPTTVIRYGLPAEGRVILRVFNLLGEEVARPVDAVQSAGYHTVAFDAGRLPSGVYVYRLTAGSFTEARKMVVIR